MEYELKCESLNLTPFNFNNSIKSLVASIAYPLCSKKYTDRNIGAYFSYVYSK